MLLCTQTYIIPKVIVGVRYSVSFVNARSCTVVTRRSMYLYVFFGDFCQLLILRMCICACVCVPVIILYFFIESHIYNYCIRMHVPEFSGIITVNLIQIKALSCWCASFRKIKPPK